MRSRNVHLAAVAAALVLGLASTSGATASPSPDEAASGPVLDQRSWLAYQSGIRVDRVFLVRPDGSRDHKIAREVPGHVRHPDFSRDGKHLAVDQLGSDDAADQVYVADGDGRGARIVAPCKPPRCLGHWEPAWSPDGHSLVVTTVGGPLTPTGPSTFGLAIIDIASDKVTPILEHPARRGQDHFARWSPDGKQLVFWRQRFRDDQPQTAIFTIGADGSDLRRLTPWRMNAGDPDWSPTGSLIVFGTRPLLDFGDGESELYTMRPDGSEITQLTNNGARGARATQPRWTPDGEGILYTRVPQRGLPRHIWLLSADGRTDRPVLQHREIYTHPVLQPTKCRPD